MCSCTGEVDVIPTKMTGGSEGTTSVLSEVDREK